MLRSVRLLCRATVLAVGVTAAVMLTAALTSGPVRDLAYMAATPDAAAGVTLDRLVADVAAALLLVAVVALAVMSGLAMAGACAERRAPRLSAACSRATPRTCRRLVATALGLALAAPTVADGAVLAADPGHGAQACPTCQVDHGHRPGHGRDDLAGLGFPDLPTTSPAHPRPASGLTRVVVTAGDSLWRIAERRLPDAASPADVAALTWRLYALNRSTIGDDPDLIHPGMTLITPEGPS